MTDNVTATALWKEPAGTDTYPIGMTWSPTAGGSPTAPGAAAANTEITVNPNTKAGYTLVSITVKDSDGTEVPVNGTTFTMPAKGVTVTVTYRAKSTGGSKTTDLVTSPVTTGVAEKLNTTDHLRYLAGYPERDIRPNGNVTRAETATIVNHMLGRAADSAWVSAHRSELNQFTDLQTPSMWYYLDMVEASNSHDYAKSNGVETWSRFIKDVIE